MKKDFLIFCIIGVIIALLISGTKIQSVDEYYLTHLDDITPESETVFLSIDCSDVFDNWALLDPALRDEKYVPASGFILPVTEYVLRSGDTVFDILDRAVRHNRIHIEYVFSAYFNSVYIRGINQLYEYSCGELSGWVYGVNGAFLNYGCSEYKLKDGDIVVIRYTCDLGGAFL